MALHCTAPATARSVAAAQLQKLEAQWFFFLFLYTILYFFLLFCLFSRSRPLLSPSLFHPLLLLLQKYTLMACESLTGPLVSLIGPYRFHTHLSISSN